MTADNVVMIGTLVFMTMTALTSPKASLLLMKVKAAQLAKESTAIPPRHQLERLFMSGVVGFIMTGVLAFFTTGLYQVMGIIPQGWPWLLGVAGGWTILTTAIVLRWGQHAYEKAKADQAQAALGLPPVGPPDPFQQLLR